MKLIVNPHKIEIIKEPVNEREINISKCNFIFDDEITNDYVKEAYFTFKGNTYKQIIVNNECNFPSEVLTEKGTVEIGVVAYLVENETEIKRYNPSPAYFNTWAGSLKDNAENSEPITPSEMEQFEQALNDGLNEVANVDIDATKEEGKATITITNRHAEEKTVEILDGAKGEKGEKGDKGDKGEQGEQGVQGIQGEKGDTGATGPQGPEGPQGPQGEQGPQGIQGPKGDKGDKGDTPDLTNYYTKQETNSLLDDKQDELVSGTNIKTINNESILGSGNIEIQGGGSTYTAGTNIEITNENVINNTIPFEGTSGNGFVVGQKKTNTTINASAVGVGKNITASGLQTVVIGNNAVGSNQMNVAIGEYATADNSYGIAIGRGAEVHGNNSTVIGYAATTYQSSSIALGREANARQSNLFQIGSSSYPINKAQIRTSTGDKELATQDYVDTAIANAITNTLGGSF